MAKFVVSKSASRKLFFELRKYIDAVIREESLSASYEAGNEYSINNVDVFVDVYERHSAIGGNRLSLSVTALYHEGKIDITAVTSGGSSGIFLKINRFGEDYFMELFEKIIDKFFEEA